MRIWSVGALVLLTALWSAAQSPPATTVGENAASQPSNEPDLSSPKAAVISYFQADQNRDLAGSKAAAIYNPAIEQMLDASFAEDQANSRLVEAATKRFGPDAAKQLQADVDAVLIEEVKKAAVHEHGDVADIGEHGDYPCRRIDGKWRYDLVRLYQNESMPDAVKYYQKTAELDDRFAKDVSAGRWSSLAQMLKDYESQAPEPPPPPDEKSKDQ